MRRTLYLCVGIVPHLLYGMVSPLPGSDVSSIEEHVPVIENNEVKLPVIDKYEVHGKIGSGGFGHVYRVKSIDKKQEYAMKIMNKQYIGHKVGLAMIYREMALHKKLVHPNIVRMVDAFEISDEVGDEIYIVTEYCNGGDLFERFDRLGVFSEATARDYAYQITQGLNYLHMKNIIHRDIKLENLFLTENGIVKIGDFGFAKVSLPGSRETRRCGSLPYAAPELLRERPSYSKEVDVWAFGITLYSMIYGIEAYTLASDRKYHVFIKHGDNVAFPQKPVISSELKDLLNKLLEVRKERRITIENVLVHPWFQSVSFEPSLNSVVEDIGRLNVESSNRNGDDV